MKNSVLRLTAGAAGSLLLSLSAHAQTAANFDELVRTELLVQAFELQTIEIPTELDSNFVTRIDIEGQPFTLVAHEHNIRSADFQLLVQDETGYHEVDAPKAATFRGELIELPGSVVTASVVNGQISATIRYDSWLEYGIQPATDVDPTAPADLHILFDTNDVDEGDRTCGLDQLSGNAFDDSQFGPPTQNLGTGLRLAEIAFDSDRQFYLDNGGSVINATNQIEAVVNNMTAIYESNASVTFELTLIIIRTTLPQPYTNFNAGNLLDQFRDYWEANLDYVKRDTTHLFTGRNLDGSTIGIAWLGGTCSGNQKYGLSERFTSNLTTLTGLVSHEVGHNFAATHCNQNPTISDPCRIMCSGLGGCTGNITSFGPQADNQIANHAQNGCLINLQDPNTVPFLAQFNNNSIGVGNWPTHQGASTSTAGVNEPSGGRALLLDAVGGQDYGDDFIRSNVFELGGQSGLALSYYTQHRGPESGEALVVEYMNSAGDWVTINTVVSDGSSQSNFVYHEHDLPGAAYHNGFRIQFRTEVNESNDDWFIDDIAVDSGGGGCPQPSTYCATSPNSVGSGTLIGSGGSNSVAANDFLLLSSGSPSGQFGIFYYGPEQTTILFGDGLRCVGAGGIGTFRLNPPVLTDVFGSAFHALDITDPPTASGQITAGQTWNFQFWYRDPQGPGGNGFNLSDGLEVAFCP